MAKIGRFVALTGYDLIALLKSSGLLVREYSVYPPYTVHFNVDGVVIEGSSMPQEKLEGVNHGSQVIG